MIMKGLRIFFCAVILCCALGEISAQDISAHEDRKAALEKEIAILDEQLAANASKSRSALSRLTLVRQKVSARKALVAASERSIRVYSDRIYSTQRQINRMQARVDTLSDHYARLLKSVYKNRDARIWYMYIIGSEDIGQAFRRYGYFKSLSSQMNSQARKIKEAQADLEKRKAELRKLKSGAEELKKEREKELVSSRRRNASPPKS